MFLHMSDHESQNEASIICILLSVSIFVFLTRVLLDHVELWAP